MMLYYGVTYMNFHSVHGTLYTSAHPDKFSAEEAKALKVQSEKDMFLTGLVTRTVEKARSFHALMTSDWMYNPCFIVGVLASDYDMVHQMKHGIVVSMQSGEDF